MVSPPIFWQTNIPFAGYPGLGLWGEKSLIWTAPADLSAVPTISHGITGTTPDGTANLSGGNWNINILIGANHPAPDEDNLQQQTGLDDVRLTVVTVPEPSTLVLLGLSVIGFASFRRRKWAA